MLTTKLSDLRRVAVRLLSTLPNDGGYPGGSHPPFRHLPMRKQNGGLLQAAEVLCQLKFQV